MFIRGIQQKIETCRKKINQVEDRSYEIIESKEQNEKRMKKNEQSLRKLQNIVK